MERNEVSNWSIFWILATALFLGTMITIWACRDTPEAQAAASRARAASVQHFAQIGEVIPLTGREILLAPSQSLCGEITLLRRAGDLVGLQKMINTDLALLGKEGVLARVLEIDHLNEQARVRIMSGPDAGQDGWLPSIYVER